jgi:hypothetical protein
VRRIAFEGERLEERDKGAVLRVGGGKGRETSELEKY